MIFKFVRRNNVYTAVRQLLRHALNSVGKEFSRMDLALAPAQIRPQKNTNCDILPYFSARYAVSDTGMAGGVETDLIGYIHRYA